jgi:hypothetical protein
MKKLVITAISMTVLAAALLFWPSTSTHTHENTVPRVEGEWDGTAELSESGKIRPVVVNQENNSLCGTVYWEGQPIGDYEILGMDFIDMSEDGDDYEANQEIMRELRRIEMNKIIDAYNARRQSSLSLFSTDAIASSHFPCCGNPGGGCRWKNYPGRRYSDVGNCFPCNTPPNCETGLVCSQSCRGCACCPSC